MNNLESALEAARTSFQTVEIKLTRWSIEVSVSDARGHSGKGRVKLVDPEKWQLATSVGALLAMEIYAGDKGTHEYAFQCVVCKSFFDSTVKHTHTND